MRIIPNYSSEPKCYYCNTNLADSEKGYRHELICIKSSGFASYSYVKVEVEVPRCEKCERRHFYAYLPTLIALVVLFIICIIKIMVPQWDNNGVWVNIFLVFMGGVLSIAGAALIGFIPKLIITSLLKVKYEGDVDSYQPIHRLRCIGFREDKPKPHTKPKAPFREDYFRKTLDKIATLDDCIIEE